MPKYKIRILAGKHSEKEYLTNEDGTPKLDREGNHMYVLHTYSASTKDPREGHTFVSRHNLHAMLDKPPGSTKFELLGIIDDEPKHTPKHDPRLAQSKPEVGIKESPSQQPATHQQSKVPDQPKK